jgi:hypothetical protein
MPPPAANGPPGAAFSPTPLSLPSSDEIKQFKQRKGLLIAGATIFGLAYYVALTAGSIGLSRNNRGSREWSAALVPFGGPFVAAGLRAEPNQKPLPGQPPPTPDNPLPPQQRPDYDGMALMLAVGATQLLGAGLFIAGLRMPHGRDKDPCQERSMRGACAPPLQLSVLVTPTFGGAGFGGAF